MFLYVFIVYLYFVFFYSCAASYGVIKNDDYKCIKAALVKSLLSNFAASYMHNDTVK